MNINELANIVLEAVIERMDKEVLAEKIYEEYADYIEKELTEKIKETIYREIQIQIEEGLPF